MGYATSVMKISYRLLEKAKYLIALKSDLTIKPRIRSFCAVKLKETLIDIGLHHLFDKFEKSLSVKSKD